jgi:hypothetical protein
MLKLRTNISSQWSMKYLNLHNRIHKACVLGAAILILPVLAYADHDSGKGNKGDNDGQRWGEKDEHRWGDHDTDKDRDRNVADRDSGKDNKGDNDGQRWGEKDGHSWGDHNTDKDRDRNVPVVPEANAGWVLIPFFGAVLFFSARQFFRAKA